LQAELLVPALVDKNNKYNLLSRVRVGESRISKEESDQAMIMHFVWVLRDTFYFERENAEKTKKWADIRVFELRFNLKGI
jgi:hypothetical protein